MNKFIINEEEKNRIINLHKKLISEQQLGNTRFNTASSGLGSRQLPTLPRVLRPTSTYTVTNNSGEASRSFYDEYKIGDYSGDADSTDTGTSGTSGGSGTSGTSGGSGGFTWKDTNLTVDELKNGKTVSMGMRGPIVKQIQELLIGKGYKEVSKSGEPDSMFGRMTKSQVEKFQTENKNEKGEKLKIDGIVGRETITALLKVPTPNTKGLETAVKSVLPTGVSPTLSPPAK
jgi:hypothetical protein